MTRTRTRGRGGFGTVVVDPGPNHLLVIGRLGPESTQGGPTLCHWPPTTGSAASRQSAPTATAPEPPPNRPWVQTGPGTDNFAPLASLTWQVHVYGEPRRGLAEVCAELQLPLHRFAWQPDMRRTGLRRAALYLVRPDGYVALAAPEADPERLRAYVVARVR